MSQLDPLPQDLPFRIISATVGRGAYASIKKAIPLDTQSPIFAVKFIHKGYATKHGRLSAKQLAMEVSLHSHVGQHHNVIEWFASGEDNIWRWIAMEYAEGGDLFDKIEADVGVRQDIAQLYFVQLVSGVSFIHSKGVAHRDLKPENIVLASDGSLKIADFGMATMFEYKGQRKLSSTLCGSPPYIAPEILLCGRANKAIAPKYSPDLVDVWSCGVILFVLLIGNTPWDEPSPDNWEFSEYVRTSGHSSDSLWCKAPSEALSLLRGLMAVDPLHRFSFSQVRQHPWYTRPNPLLTSEGKVSDPISLATQMLENLRIDFSQLPRSQPEPAMATERLGGRTGAGIDHFSTQPETPIVDMKWEWERHAPAASLPPRAADGHGMIINSIADEPFMSQFSPTPGPSMTLTQQARRFRDICPPESLTRFFSHVPPAHLVNMLSAALHQLNVPLPPVSLNTTGCVLANIRIRTLDGRGQSIHGEIMIEKVYAPEDGEYLDVRFLKIRGDPLEWRRFFKKVVVLCKDGVYVKSP
ncbi:hypothetical protein CDD81_4482 [Ophiocordyceps australis]|uniref:Protein kinase domain-containing protein n=1 Tax=Ophiocordyceps australis TaxID=1399860 RepID=A0A2C5YED6_9HYPO|nr:hypothetical protein CDD81_4482 [Ophiocordyceps australis]